MTRKIHRVLPVLAVVVALGSALPAAAAGDDPEAIRANLLAYVANLDQVPAPLLESVYGGRLSLTEARDTVLAMSPEQLRRIEATLEEVPYWRELPSLLAASLPSEERFSPLELAAAVSAQLPAAGTAGLRSQMLSMVDALETLPAGVAGSDYRARVERLRQRLETLSPEEVVTLRQAMSQRMPAWRSAIEARLAGEAPGAGLALRDGSSCRSQSFPNDVLCEVDRIVDQIAAIPDQVVAFADDAFDSITGFFTDLLASFSFDLIPSEAQILSGIEATVGVDLRNPSSLMSYVARIPKVEPPCPPVGFFIPALGTLGTVEADLRCKRSIKWVAQAIYDHAPDDIWGTPFKLAMAAVFYPIDYLCLCYEAAAEIRFDDEQANHRGLVFKGLDVKVSTRATQASVDTAQATTVAVGSAVGGVQNQVDTLDASVADLDRDVAQVEAKLDVLDVKIDHVQDQEDDQSLFLLDFQELALRLRIEADLVRSGNDRVSSFQLPEAVGGFLEVVQGIVFDTVETRAEAGRNVDQARSDLARADQAYAELDFRRAYDYYRKAYQDAVRGQV